MTAEALAGVLEAIATAIRALPAAQAVDVAAAVAASAPTPAPLAPIPAPPAPVEEPPSDTMAEWLVTFRTIIKGRGYSAQTLKNRGTCINFVEQQLGARPLRAIKPHEIATVLKLCSPHKAGRVLMELRDIFVEAIANGAAETNPAAHVKKPSSSGLRKRRP